MEVSRQKAMTMVVPQMNKIYSHYLSKYNLDEMLKDPFKMFILGFPVSAYSSSLSIAYGV